MQQGPVRYFTRLLKGDFSQGQALWINLITALAIIKTIAAASTLFNVIQNPVISTRIWLPLLAFTLVVIIPIIFFSAIKATYIHLTIFKGQQASLFVFGTIFIVGFLTLKDISASTPKIKNMWHIATLSDDYNFLIKLDKDDMSVAILSGQLNYNSAKQTRLFLDENADVKTLELNLSAGHLFESRSLAKTISDRDLNTSVADTCAATCMLAFVAGNERSASEQAALKFHYYDGYDNGYRSDWLISREQEADRAYYVRMGISKKLSYQIYYITKADEYLEPSKNRLLQAGVLTKLDPI